MISSRDIALLGTGIEAGAGVAGSLSQAAALRAEGRYESERLASGARFADLEAGMIRKAGDQAASVRAQEGAQLVGRQLAAQAASGIDVSSGSAADVRMGAQASADLDVENLRAGAFLQAWGKEREAEDLRLASKAVRSRSKFASRVTASTAGFRLAKGMLDASEIFGRRDYWDPPQGKPMSDVRNR